MANLALYRKYRPTTFDELKGQEHVTVPLIQALKNGKLNHAYLFSGPRGCGKTSSARILARSLNCEQGPTPTPCGVCRSCVSLAPDGAGSLDVIEIDAASHGGVDDARDLRERAFFAPVSSRYKVYVIDEAHMVSSAGFNALLKLVEEPPDFVKFVFATTEPDKVLQTIRSRTHHYPFRLVPPGVLRSLLEEICAREGASVEPTVFPLVVRAGGGSVRDSLSILDQLLAGAGPSGVLYADAVRLLGVTDSALLDEVCDALAAADGAGVFTAVDRVVEAGHDPRRFASDLLERLRDLVILDKVPDAAAKALIDAPADQLERMVGQTLRLGGASLSRMADVVHEGLVQMRGTASPRLLLELICARLLLPGADDSHGALLQRLERLERRFDIAGEGAQAAPSRDRTVGVPVTSTDTAVADTAQSSTPAAARKAAPTPRQASTPPARPTPPAHAVSVASPDAPVADNPKSAPPVAAAPTPAPAPAPTLAPVPAPTHSAGAIDAAAVRRLWPEILERLKKRRVVWSLMQNATPRSVEGTELVLAVQHQGLARRFTDDQVVRTLQDALHEVLGVRWSVRAVVDGAAQAPARNAERPPQQQQQPQKPNVEQHQQPESGGWPEVREIVRDAASDAEPDPEPPPPDDYAGFDPGDEPDDDAPGQAPPRRDAEAEALSLLEKQLGARKIGELN